MTFKNSGLNEEILSAVYDLGFEEPTAIQGEIIPLVFNTQKDIIAIAQTGTGKTAAFGLPLIQITSPAPEHIHTLVLCPTRELCMQIAGDMEKFSKYTKGFKSVAVYGGADIRTQINAIRKGCSMVVGTPGRVLDLVRRKVLDFSYIRWLVLDEADEMLNMGFKEDLDIILSETPESKRTFLFSATMGREVLSIARKYMDDPEEVRVGNQNHGAENVRHDYYMVHARDRYAVLKRIVDINPNIYGIVFCRTRQITREVAEKLLADGYNADALHGDLSQAQRDHVMNRFRRRQLQLLVATDVAARGLDVNDLSHIINFDLPDDSEIYIHRTGRTARAGKSGVAITIIQAREQNKIRNLEKTTGRKFNLKAVPTGQEICEKQLFNMVDRVENVQVDDDQIGRFLPVIFKKLEWLSREDLIKHFVSVEFNRFLEYYRDASDLNISRNEPERKPQRERKFVSLRMNVGQKTGLNPRRLIGMINDQTRNHKIPIGRINVGPRSSSFEVDQYFLKNVLSAFRNVHFEGVRIKVERGGPGNKTRIKYQK